jgi:hypothetical protein
MTDGGATIVLHRKVSWSSSTVQLAVRVDDQEVARLKIGNTVAVDVTPGPHTVKVMYRNREVKYRNRTGPLTVEVGPDETLRVNLRTTGQPIRVELTADKPVKSE